MDGLVVATAIAGIVVLAALWVRRQQREDAVRLEAVQAELRSELELRGRLEAELVEVRDTMERELGQRTAALRRSLEVGGRERDQARRREEQFRRAVEASPAAFVLVDATGRIQLVNSQTERYFGYDRGELVGESVELLVPDALRAGHAEHVSRFMQAPRTTSMGPSRALQGRRSDGTFFPVEIGLNPIDSPDGVQVLASVLDTTDRDRSEKLLILKTRELERSNRQLSEFASVVSHDLKSPLRGIASLAEWIATDHAEALGGEGQEQLALLRERTVWLHQMIEGLLEFARAGRNPSKRTLVDAAEVVREVISVLAPPPNIEVRIEEPLPECTAAEVNLGQVFQNLISNAIQHMGKPTGVITVRGRTVDDKEVEYSVADDGVGIPREHHERIFRIFQTLEPVDPGSNDTDRKSRSTGIGLAIVQKIVESAGGRLSVESEPGEGATFVFTLPGAP